MAPIRLAGLPRRSRVLLIVVVLCCTLLLLPAPRERVGQALLFTFFSPHSWHTRNGESAGPDILRFIDPLIGTTNGGGLCRRRSSAGLPVLVQADVENRPCVPRSHTAVW